MGAHRFTKCLYKDNGEKCVNVIRREPCVQYLERRGKETKTRCTDQSLKSALSLVVESLKEDTIGSEKDLKSRIIDIMYSTNKEWKTNRKKYVIIR